MVLRISRLHWEYEIYIALSRVQSAIHKLMPELQRVPPVTTAR